MQVDVIRDRAGFDRLQADWNRLLAEDCAAPSGMDATSGFAWASALLDSFLAGQDWFIAVARDQSGVAGILPVCRRTPETAAFPAPRTLCPITSLHGGRNGFLVRNGAPEILYRLIDCLIERVPSWDLLGFHVVDDSRSAQMLVALPGAIRFAIRRQGSRSSPFLLLPENADAWIASMKPSLRQSLNRHRRQLEKLGSLRFELFRDPADVPRYREAMMAVERTSWKQAAGTSIACKPEQERFYRALLPHAARGGQWLSGLLTLDGEPIAHRLSIASHGVALGLKTSYVETMKKYSPASVLQWMYLQHVHALGIRCFDFSGEAESHKMQWTDDTYRLTGMRLFRPTVRGRIARLRNRLGQLRRQEREPS